ncbi:MAG: DUF3276 family protein [Armatimonadetes bacterium]|nr:DUF3276 family protein [Armatimonadota bacterium]
MKSGHTELYAGRQQTGNRTYFFDVKKGPAGQVRLEITESKRKEDGFERHCVMVFEEDVSGFVGELMKAVSAIGEVDEGGQRPPVPPRIAEIRAKHPRAYEKWSEKENDWLRRELDAGIAVAEIAKLHKRQPSAVKSRIRHLETQ